MSKSIKHLTYEIINGKMVWRKLNPCENRISECVECQKEIKKKKAQEKSESVLEVMSGDSA